MKKTLLLLPLLFPLLAWAGGKEICTLKPGVLQVAVANAFPPVVMTGPDNKLTGSDVEFLTSFAKDRKLGIEWVIFPFDGIWNRTADDSADLAAESITPLASRKTPGMHFSEPYVRVQRTLMIHKTDAAKYKTIKDFAGKKIAFIAGAMPELDLKKRALKSTTLVGMPNFNEITAALKNGSVDAAAEGTITSNYYVREHPEFMVIDAHEYNPKDPEYLAFAVRDKGCALRERLNAFIKTHSYPSGEPLPKGLKRKL